MSQTFFLGDRAIGSQHPPFIVAEISGNHNGSLQRAERIIEACADAGADAIKLQTYTPDTMTLDVSEGEFRIEGTGTPWDGCSLYELYGQAATPWDWHERLFDCARQRGLIAFSSPFDVTAVDFLEALDAPAYKIASFENVDIPLIKKVAATGKPIFISTGMATLAEIDEAVRAAKNAGCRNLVLLKCTSSYPAHPSFSNLSTLPILAENFSCPVGVSDHTLGIGAAVASIALGACVIEKHVTLSRAEGGVDASFSLEPAELAQLVNEAKTAWQSLGQTWFGPTEPERHTLVFRRSLYFVKNMEAGEVVTTEHVRSIRPGLGLPPKYLSAVLGLRTARSIKRGTAVSWDLFQ